jgi:hypothetical protein
MNVSFRNALRKAKPSPAMAVAFVALLAALGGTAGALSGKNGVDNNDIKKNAVDSANIVKNGVTGTDAKESTFGEVPDAANGVQAYARISNAGAVQTEPLALNIVSSNVTNPTAGVYCISGLTFTPKTVLITGDAEATNAQDNWFVASVNTDNGQCPGVEQVSIESRDEDNAGGTTLQNGGFYIVMN